MVFVYEHLCGGGLLGAAAVSTSLLSEGIAMATAVAADLAAANAGPVHLLADPRLPEWAENLGRKISSCQLHFAASPSEWQRWFDRLVDDASYTLVIAPETGGVLAGLSRRVRQFGGRLLGPTGDFIDVASDKNKTCSRLTEAGVPVPPGRVCSDASAFASQWKQFPAVVKPSDGCGSEGVSFVGGAAALEPALARAGLSCRVEEYVPGQPASVSALLTADGPVTLPACYQTIAWSSSCLSPGVQAKGVPRYKGGRLPVDDSHAPRCRTLAQAALGAMPASRGFVGVDLVLGDAEDGSEDFVIEINPRLTTSYVGLRQLALTNLAAALINAREGRPADLRFSSQRIQFLSSGDTMILHG